MSEIDSGIDLGGLLAAAAADPKPPSSAPDDIPEGDSPADRALAGYMMAVNMVCGAAEADCHASYRHRQAMYAAEIARLETHGGTADPAVVDALRAQTAQDAQQALRCAELSATAKSGHQQVRELMQHLLDAVHGLRPPRTEREAAAVGVKERKLVSAAVDTINAMTQGWLDYQGTGTTVEEFLAAHGLDTTVPPY